MSTVMKVKMSRHVIEDRLDRLSSCIECLGVGEVILETYRQDCRVCLTSTGLCLIYAKNENLLITGYMCTVKQCMGIYYSCGYEKVPEKFFKTVMRNEKKYSFLLEK